MTQWTIWAPVSTLVVTLFGAIIAAMSFQRNEAGKTVSQQTAVLTDMRDLNDELKEELERTRGRVDALEQALETAQNLNRMLQLSVHHLEAEVASLRHLLEDRGISE